MVSYTVHRQMEMLLVAALVLVVAVPVGAGGLFEYNKVEIVTVYAPAVSSGGQGVLSKITLAIAYPGNGRVFFSALPYTEVETQGAARLATYVASLITGEELSRYDYYVLVESDVPLIGGPSAGGLIAVGFVALLSGTKIDPSVTMTGMVNPDGSIGPVGGLKEKLEAAATNGFKVFLIPTGQRTYTYPVYEEYRRGPFVIRRVAYASIDLVDYGKKLGVDVVEVSSIGEAVYHFTGLKLASNLTLPVDIREKVLGASRGFYEDLSSRVRHLVYDAAQLAQRLGGYYGYQYRQAIASLNQTIASLDSVVGEYPVYASILLPSVYKSALKYYWALQVGSGELTVDQVLNSVVESINDAMGAVHVESCSLENGLARALLYNAWIYYSIATNTSDTSSQVEYAGEALRLVELAKLHNGLSVVGQTPLNCSASKLVEMYSNALGVYTYVSRLVEETGAQVTYLEKASRYVDVLSYGYEHGGPIVYGAGVLVMGYSSLSVHTAFNTVSTVLSERFKLLGAYPGVATPVVAYYLELVEDSIVLGDNDTAAFALSLAIAALQVQASNPGEARTRYTAPEEETGTSLPPIQGGYPGTQVPEAGNATAGADLRGQLRLVLLFVVLLVALVVVAYVVLRVVARS